MSESYRECSLDANKCVYTKELLYNDTAEYEIKIGGLKSTKNPTNLLNTTSTRYAEEKINEVSYDWITLKWNLISNGWGRQLQVKCKENTSSLDRSVKIYLKYKSHVSDGYVLIKQLSAPSSSGTDFKFYNPTNIGFYTTEDLYVILTSLEIDELVSVSNYSPVAIYIPKYTLFPPNGYASSFNGSKYTVEIYDSADTATRFSILENLGSKQCGYAVTDNIIESCAYVSDKFQTNIISNGYMSLKDLYINTVICCYNKVIDSNDKKIITLNNELYIPYQIKDLYNMYIGTGNKPYVFYAHQNDLIDKGTSITLRTVTYPGKLQAELFVLVVIHDEPDGLNYFDVETILIYTHEKHSKYILFSKDNTLSSYLNSNRKDGITNDFACYTINKGLELSASTIKMIKNNRKDIDDDDSIFPSNFQEVDNIPNDKDLMFPELLSIAESDYKIVLYNDEAFTYVHSGEDNGLVLHVPVNNDDKYVTEDREHSLNKKQLTHIYNIWKNTLSSSTVTNINLDRDVLFENELTKYYGICILLKEYIRYPVE